VVAVHGGANRAVPAPVSVTAGTGVPSFNNRSQRFWQGDDQGLTLSPF